MHTNDSLAASCEAGPVRGAGLRRLLARAPRYRVLLIATALIAALLIAAPAPASASGGTVVTVNEGESIQAAIDAADPGTTFLVKGHHVENVWVYKDDISLVGRGATLTVPDEPVPTPCAPPEVPVTLICVIPASAAGGAVPDPGDYIQGVRITGFTLNNPFYDAIGTIFTNDVDITDNVVNGPGCDGIFVIFSEKVRVNRNTVTGAECSGINVNAASDVRIQHNVANDSFGNGIAVNDSTHVVLNRNTATGNCIGIGVVDGDDQGYGIRADDFSGDVIRISSNTTNANNSTCPFGPETNVGGTGIVVGGMDHLTVKNNTASDNVVGVTSLTAGGIVIADFPNPDGTSEPTDFVRVQNNTAEGNSSEAGPGDLVVSIAGDHLTITNNTCDYGIPDPDICR